MEFKINNLEELRKVKHEHSSKYSEDQESNDEFTINYM